ncbi:MAG: 4-vinyl reductase [Chloroflexi bacterium RBG_13_56_8b]|nr:MAG: 4-vinyl reductase [Chloroflexi bacterium RBG_13_56_8b]
MLKKIQVKVLLFGMETLEKHPLFARLVLRPLSKAPFLKKKLMVLIKAFMGATAFEIHDVDLKRGRIGIGGVEEIIFGSKIIEQLHKVLESRLSEDEKNQALYELGYNLCRWEVSTALEGGQWAPGILVPLIANSTIVDDVRSDPHLARFFLKVMGMISRLITDEGGWGHLEFELQSKPLRVLLSNSQEAAWLGPSEKPVCHLYAGIVAGYTSAISGEELHAREVSCKAMGEPCCTFEIDR